MTRRSRTAMMNFFIKDPPLSVLYEWYYSPREPAGVLTN
jgi:hypothetical protein